MEVTKRIHKGWEEWEKLKKERPELIEGMTQMKSLFGKYQYIYTSHLGEISLVHLIIFEDNYWGIMELSANNLFTDVEKFNSKKEAEKRIKELLNG